jgi:succinoglycan biosynthesis protein ExoM
MPPKISICVCTFRRPQRLSALLRSLRLLDPKTPTLEIIVIDNDAQLTAKPVVDQAVAEGLCIVYDVEPIQNIALARNLSVQRARGDWVAFIDDDEEADPSWLVELWRLAQDGSIDGVFGTVERRFESGIPQWIRAAYPGQQRQTGVRLDWWETATNNALIRRSSILALDKLFDSTFGLTGGEDSDLFYRMSKLGSVLVGNTSAIVYETVTRERARISYLLKWWLGSGALAARINFSNTSLWRQKQWLCATMYWSIRHLLVGILSFPFSRSQGMHLIGRAALEGGAVFGRLTGSLIERYPRHSQTLFFDDAK